MIQGFRRVLQASVVAALLTGATLVFSGSAQALPATCASLKEQSNWFWNSASYEFWMANYLRSVGEDELADDYMAEGDNDVAEGIRIDRQMSRMHCPI